MISFKEYLLLESGCAVYSLDQIKDLKKFADNLIRKFDIDIEFTKHFGDRMSDPRNTPCIKLSELQQLFKKIEKDQAQKLKAALADYEAVLIDLQKDLNLPFVIELNRNNEFNVRFKTIIRKKGFRTTNKVVEY